MSEYEGSEIEDEQSEDGELTKSPQLSKDDQGAFSLSDEEGADDTTDSLEIKPPQATIHRRRPRPSTSSGKRKHSDRERSRISGQLHKSESHRKSHHRSRDHRERHGEERLREKKHRREHREPHMIPSSRSGDLRERLLDKRRTGGSTSSSGPGSSSAGGAGGSSSNNGGSVNNIITSTSTNVKPERREETAREKAERIEKEQRRERLLEAEREMLRQKEAYKRELEARRERQSLEKQKELRELTRKRERSRSRELTRRRHEDKSQDEDLLIVTVTDDESSVEEEGLEEGEHSSEDEHEDQDMDQEMEHELQERVDEQEEDDDEDSASSSASESGSVSASASGSEDENNMKNDLQSSYKNGDEGMDISPPLIAVSSPLAVAGLKEGNERNGTGGSPRAAAQAEPELPAPEPEEEEDDGLPPYLPAIQGCRSVEEFQCLNRIEEGTYGVVYRARDKRTEEVVALKRLKMEKEKEGFPITSLREINTLLKAQHPNIVTVREIVVGSNMDKIFIVMDYVEHDLKSLMETMKHKKQVFLPGEVKCLLAQLLKAVAHLHDNWILHRDLKTSNLLLSHRGVLKVGDFGLAREYGSPLKSYTPIVVTLWYRAPELLLCTKEYSTPIDMWSVGCIFGELVSMQAMFPGKSEVDQLNRIFKELGTPNEKIWIGYSRLPAVQKMTFVEHAPGGLRQRYGAMLTEAAMALMLRFLTYDPTRRITAEEALRHEYFQEPPLAIDPAMFPTWPAKSELGHRKAAAASPKPPPGGAQYTQLGDTDEDVAIGFHMGLLEKGRSAIGPGFSLKF